MHNLKVNTQTSAISHESRLGQEILPLLNNMNNQRTTRMPEMSLTRPWIRSRLLPPARQSMAKESLTNCPRAFNRYKWASNKKVAQAPLSLVEVSPVISPVVSSSSNGKRIRRSYLGMYRPLPAHRVEEWLQLYHTPTDIVKAVR